MHVLWNYVEINYSKYFFEAIIFYLFDIDILKYKKMYS